MIAGETVWVSTVAAQGTDPFGAPAVQEDEPERVDDVLVAPASAADSLSAVAPDRDRTALSLHFPKTYSGELRGRRVKVRGHWYAVQGAPAHYTEGNTPTRWWMPVEAVRVDG